MHTYIHTYMHTYIHTYIHKFIHTYMHTHIHTYIQGPQSRTSLTAWLSSTALPAVGKAKKLAITTTFSSTIWICPFVVADASTHHRQTNGNAVVKSLCTFATFINTFLIAFVAAPRVSRGRAMMTMTSATRNGAQRAKPAQSFRLTSSSTLPKRRSRRLKDKSRRSPSPYRDCETADTYKFFEPCVAVQVWHCRLS